MSPRYTLATSSQMKKLTHEGAAFDLVHPLWRLVDQISCQCARGNAVNASTSAFASAISGPIFGMTS
jgi:hypothetical protein